MQSSAGSHGSQGLRQSAWKKALGPSATTRLAAKGQRPEGWGDGAPQGKSEEALGLRALGSNPSCAHFRLCDEPPTSLLCIVSSPGKRVESLTTVVMELRSATQQSYASLLEHVPCTRS